MNIIIGVYMCVCIFVCVCVTESSPAQISLVFPAAVKNGMNEPAQ